MIFNIFGVGRSGTKAIQIYLTYLLASVEGKVKINYEPYFWLTRSGPVSYEGLKYHFEVPQFCKSSEKFSDAHKKYLSRLKDSENSTVTKFIRGNGRINAINQILQPDYSILVIRDLYQVLNSLHQMDWNFYSVGQSYFKRSYAVFWNEIESYLLELNDFPLKKELFSQKLTMVSKNALYWYSMNRAALDNSDNKLIVITYENILNVNQLFCKILGVELDGLPNIKDEMFRGENLRLQFPLMDLKPKTYNLLKQRLNELNWYFTKGRLKHWMPPMFTQKLGNIVLLNNTISRKNHQKTLKVDFSIRSNVLFDFLNMDIMERVANTKIV